MGKYGRKGRNTGRLTRDGDADGDEKNEKCGDSKPRWRIVPGVSDELCLVGAIILACFMSLES